MKKSLGLDTPVATEKNQNQTSGRQIQRSLTMGTMGKKQRQLIFNVKDSPVVKYKSSKSSSSQIISRAQLTFDIVRKIMAEHMDFSKFANDPKM